MAGEAGAAQGWGTRAWPQVAGRRYGAAGNVCVGVRVCARAHHGGAARHNPAAHAPSLPPCAGGAPFAMFGDVNAARTRPHTAGRPQACPSARPECARHGTSECRGQCGSPGALQCQAWRGRHNALVGVGGRRARTASHACAYPKVFGRRRQRWLVCVVDCKAQRWRRSGAASQASCLRPAFAVLGCGMATVLIRRRHRQYMCVRGRRRRS